MQEWSKIPINTLLNLVDRLPRRVEAVLGAKGGNGMSLKLKCESRQVSENFWQYSVCMRQAVQILNVLDSQKILTKPVIRYRIKGHTNNAGILRVPLERI